MLDCITVPGTKTLYVVLHIRLLIIENGGKGKGVCPGTLVTILILVITNSAQEGIVSDARTEKFGVKIQHVSPIVQHVQLDKEQMGTLIWSLS